MGKKITLTVDVQAQLNSFQADLSKMQGMLDKLKMPNQASYNTALKQLQDRYKHILEMTEGNKVDLVDEKKIGSEFNAIRKTFSDLVMRMQRDSDKISLVDTKKTDALKQALKDIKKNIKDVLSGDNKSEVLEKAQTEVNLLKKESNKLQQVAMDAEKAFKPYQDQYDILIEKQATLAKEAEEYEKKLQEAAVNKKGEKMAHPMQSSTYRKTLEELTPDIG